MEHNSLADKLQNEISKFTQVLEEGGVTKSIPSIFTYWASKFLSPRLREVFNEVDINSIFAKEILEYAGRSNKKTPICVLSLGSGDCLTEINIAKKLLDCGILIDFTCTDLNATVLNFAKDFAEKEGVSDYFRFEVLNLNNKFPEGSFDVVMANHSLHHFIELEFIFNNVYSKLNDEGSFVISDMIGRNGHMRWPEALKFVENLWDFLPTDKKFNGFAKCYEEVYVNYDCTLDDTFEGVRAQDILPLLLERFYFKKFVGHGNVIDVFIDRIYGGNFSPTSEIDCKFIDYVESLNSTLIDFGIVKPTAMFATLVKYNHPCNYSRWSPQFCLRPPYSQPCESNSSAPPLQATITEPKPESVKDQHLSRLWDRAT